MKSICLFASYFNGSQLPYYIKIYLQELKKQYKQVVFLASKEITAADQEFLENRDIQFTIETNEGFDFGLWYKALQRIDVSGYDQLVLVNDSAVLFKSLDKFVEWSKADSADFQGITISSAIEVHVQSYFLVIKKSAIQDTLSYFNKNGILQNISEVIRIYEIGLSSYLISKGFKISAYLDNDGYTGEYSPYYQCVDYHVLNGIPLIKKKILYASYRKEELFTLARMNFNLSIHYYMDLIKNTNHDLILDINKLKQEAGNGMSLLQRVKYELMRKLITSYRYVLKK